MSERRLELRYRRPAASVVDGEAQWEVHKLGSKKPPFLVVAKVDGHMSPTSIMGAIESSSLAAELAGSPVLLLPAGTEFELWEVES